MDPIEQIDPSHDTTYVIMREVQRRGGEIWVCTSRQITIDRGTPEAGARRVDLHDLPGERHFRVVEERRIPVETFDLIWMREDPPFDQQYLYATYLLELVSVPVLNDPAGIRDSNEKLFILQFPRHIAPTWVGADPEGIRGFLEDVGGEAVGKPLDGYGGETVFRLTRGDPNLSALVETLTRKGRRTGRVREYLPQVGGKGDRRIIVLGGNPIGGLTRLPAEGDFRCNLHSGGSASGVGVSSREEEICQDLKPRLLERGLHLVGLDLIADTLTEINVTSPTCVQEINQLAETRLEERIVDYSETLSGG